MKTAYETFGSLAIKPVIEGSSCKVTSLHEYLTENEADEYSETGSIVEQTLDDIKGKPLAETESDRRFAAVALAVAGFAMFFFSFGPFF